MITARSCLQASTQSQRLAAPPWEPWLAWDALGGCSGSRRRRFCGARCVWRRQSLPLRHGSNRGLHFMVRKKEANGAVRENSSAILMRCNAALVGRLCHAYLQKLRHQQWLCMCAAGGAPDGATAQAQAAHACFERLAHTASAAMACIVLNATLVLFVMHRWRGAHCTQHGSFMCLFRHGPQLSVIRHIRGACILRHVIVRSRIPGQHVLIM